MPPNSVLATKVSVHAANEHSLLKPAGKGSRMTDMFTASFRADNEDNLSEPCHLQELFSIDFG